MFLRCSLQFRRPHPEINKHVTREQLAGFCDPMNNLGQAGGDHQDRQC